MDNLQLSRAIDINACYLGIDKLVLMENAGKEISIKASKFNSIAIFSGVGNNGGDGLVAARHLSGAGKRVKVYSLDGKRTEENKINFDLIKKLDSVEIEFITDSSQCKRIMEELNEFDCIVDALIGTGIHGELREPVKTIIDTINKSKAYKISVDIPTKGFKPDLTLSFHIPKTEDAEVVNIGIPREAELYTGPGDVYLAFPKRSGYEHKGDFGRVLVVGGSKEFIGAPSLVALASLRTGADLSLIASPRYVVDRSVKNPNFIFIRLNSEFYIDKGDVDDILNINHDSIVIGNGIGTEEETRYAVKRILKRAEKPVVMDADALKIIKEKDLRRNSNGNVVITPHKKEFEILFEDPVDSVIVKEYAEKTKTTILLKGNTDIISDGNGIKFNRTGNAGMTVGGTGDVLAGILGALICNNNIDGFMASSAAAFICGVAGDLCLRDYGYNFLATDVIEKIPDALLFCKEFE